jgi:GntR family transcriptional regulator, transcriptional repressor for pyruvate dehydrogenase complex
MGLMSEVQRNAQGRRLLADEVTDELLSGIIDGRYPPDSALPPEAELAREARVSRLTVREAVKTLRAKNVVRVDRGRGTYVNPADQWTALDALARATVQRRSTLTGALPQRLIEARRIVEVGAAELAAARHTDEDIAMLEKHLGEMAAAAQIEDVDAFVAADIAFHETVLHAAGNVFIAALLDPLSQLLVPARRQTSEFDAIRRHALAHHAAILEAIRTSAPERARRAMHDHIQQTEDDLRAYVLEAEPSD